MVRPQPLPPDGVISNRRLAQIRRRHREKILKMAQRQKDREAASEQRKIDKLETTNKPETIEPKPEIKEENPNSPRRIIRDIQMQRLAKRKKSAPVENKEFYPEKLKRKVVYKKIKLTPNQELVPLGCINKRKRGDPKKGEEYEQVLVNEMPNENVPNAPKRKVRNIIREETVEEIIMRIEETDSLTDEDLMEILTCPSPVWWEEPMNPFYFDEEPINKKPLKTQRKRQNQATIKQKETDNRIDKLEISLANRDEKFVAKRSTLENILSNIKDNIEPENNSSSRKEAIQKRQWKNLDEANPAFGFKRNSKGRFLRKKIGSSPITVSDVSDKEETPSNNTNNPKTTPKNNDSDKPTPKKSNLTKTSEINNIDLTNNEKDNLATDKTSESNINVAINPVSIKINDTNESSVDITKTVINNDLKENKYSKESPKALIWTSNTGECKVINFTQDTEMSSDGVEIVTDSVDLEIPQELPPLKWYPKTDIKENAETTSFKSNDQLTDDNTNLSDNDNVKDLLNSEEKERNIEGDGNIDIAEDIDTASSQCEDENEITNNNNESDKSNDNDTNDINDIEPDNCIDITDCEETNSKTADEEKSTEATNKNPILGAIEKAIYYFRKESTDATSEGVEEDKKRDDYVVVYKIDETYKDASELRNEELKGIGNVNAIFEGDAVSGTLEDFYKNIKNCHKKVISKKEG